MMRPNEEEGCLFGINEGTHEQTKRRVSQRIKYEEQNINISTTLITIYNTVKPVQGLFIRLSQFKKSPA